MKVFYISQTTTTQKSTKKDTSGSVETNKITQLLEKTNRRVIERQKEEEEEKDTQKLFQVGLSKVFLKTPVYAGLESARDAHMSASAVLIQSVWRMYWVSS